MRSEEQIGSNLQVLREAEGMSQQSLAEKMKDLGWKWSQSTVWSIEKGDRPLRLAEAEAIADILQRPIDVLLARDGEAVVHGATRAVSERYNEILKAMEAYDDARAQLALALDKIPASEKRGLLRISTDWVGQTVSSALDDYRRSEAAEFSAMLARDSITQDQYDTASRRDQWMDRFNAAQRAFREGRDGEHQAEA